MSEEAVQKLLPPHTELSRPFWEGCERGELRVQACQDCGRKQFYPRIFCVNCGSRNLRWEAVSGKGQVASFTVVRRGISSAYEAPYVVALVDLEEGPRMMSQIRTDEPDDIAIGAQVEVSFEAWSEELSVPIFLPAEEEK